MPQLLLILQAGKPVPRVLHEFRSGIVARFTTGKHNFLFGFEVLPRFRLAGTVAFCFMDEVMYAVFAGSQIPMDVQYAYDPSQYDELTMPHVLLIDDERKLTDPLQASFTRAGYAVSVANDGHTGLSMALVERPDVIVLDVMMPGLDGWQVCQSIREHSIVPIIMLTALDDSVDRIKGLELGADDYLVKPFSFKELEAHVRAMLRRVSLERGGQLPTQLRMGAIVLDGEARRVTKNGVEITLRQKEYEILLLLMSHAGKVVSRDRLFDEVWGTDWLGDTRTLDVHMSWLRSKLEDDPTNPQYLKTVRGVGYRFCKPES